MRKIVTLTTFLVACSAFADDGWWSEAGGIGCFGKAHPTIRMVSEGLKITLHTKDAADVDVLFTFANEGPATTATMAFPEKYEMRTEGSLDHFQTWVDGRRVSARRKVIVKGDKADLDNEGEAVWLKTVSFCYHQTRHVRVRYHGWYWGNTSGDLGMTYTLTTGTTWKGPIGSCAITVDWSQVKGGLSAPYLDLTPAKWQVIGKRRVRAVIKNWDPDEDLLLEMIPGFWNFWINGVQLTPEARSYYGRPYTLGSAADPMIKATAIDAFFGGMAKRKPEDKDLDWVEWKNPVVERFGGPFSLEKQRLVFLSGKAITLRRPWKIVPGVDGREPHAFVYIKDVVEALGGRFRYDPRWERAEIRF